MGVGWSVHATSHECDRPQKSRLAQLQGQFLKVKERRSSYLDNSSMRFEKIIVVNSGCGRAVRVWQIKSSFKEIWPRYLTVMTRVAGFYCPSPNFSKEFGSSEFLFRRLHAGWSPCNVGLALVSPIWTSKCFLHKKSEGFERLEPKNLKKTWLLPVKVILRFSTNIVMQPFANSARLYHQ